MAMFCYSSSRPKRGQPNMADSVESRGDPKVIETLKRVATRQMSREERREQRVSFIVGTMGSGSTVTREEVEKVLDEQEG